MASRILTGDVFDMLPTIEPGSVDCAVTSPPYWALRSYLPKGHPLKPRELGSEKTPGEFVRNMVRVFGLVRGCLADHGTCWVNIGDSYSVKPVGRFNGGSTLLAGRDLSGHEEGNKADKTLSGISEGNLCLIPQRLAIALQDDGWLVRSVVIWHKPSAMPASLAGWMWVRCRVKAKAGRTGASGVGANGANGKWIEGTSHLQPGNNAEWSDCPGCKKCQPHGGYVLRRGSWRPTSSYEPILMLAKKPGYYCDGLAVQTPAKSATVSRDKYTRIIDDPDEQFAVQHDHETVSAGGANLRDVWTIPAEPLKEKHYAAFPTELVRLCLKAGTSEKGYCPACGKPWARVVTEPSGGSTGKGSWIDHGNDDETGCIGANTRVHSGSDAKTYQPPKTLGWRQTCPCPPHEPRPALVLDPFAGSGRTGVCAQRMFLDFVGVELNPEYAAMSERILKADCPLFAG